MPEAETAPRTVLTAHNPVVPMQILKNINVDDEKLYGDNTFVHDHKLSRHCIGLSGMKFSDDEIEELASKIRKMKEEGTHFMLLYRIFNKETGLNVKRSWIRPYQP
mgnify:CR=1 FL=1